MTTFHVFVAVVFSILFAMAGWELCWWYNQKKIRVAKESEFVMYTGDENAIPTEPKTRYEQLYEQADRGREASAVLDKLKETMQHQQASALSNLTKVDKLITEPKDLLIYQAGYLASLVGLEQGLRNSVNAGKIAEKALTNLQQQKSQARQPSQSL